MKPSDNEKVNPRTSRVQRVILDAAIELFFEQGANGVTAARIAEKTGVARTTIYRHWPDQPSLILATIDAMVAADFSAPDTGDFEADLTSAVTRIRTRIVKRPVRLVYGALVDQAVHHDAFAGALRRFTEALTAEVVVVLATAQERGDLSTELDTKAAAAMLAGPLLHQHVLMLDTIPDDLINEIVTQFLRSHVHK